MIVRPRLHWFWMLLAWRGSVLPQLLPRLFMVLCVSFVAVAAHDHILRITVNLSTVPFSLIGIALAVFLGFRNNASYDRYWEGRKLWGQLTNDTRSLVREALTLTPDGGLTPRVRELVDLLCALPHALRHQLRNTDPRDDLAKQLPPAVLERVMASRFRPATLMLCVSEWVHREAREGRLDRWAVLAIDRNLNGLSDVIGGCERIVSTPLPFAYTDDSPHRLLLLRAAAVRARRQRRLAHAGLRGIRRVCVHGARDHRRADRRSVRHRGQRPRAGNDVQRHRGRAARPDRRSGESQFAVAGRESIAAVSANAPPPFAATAPALNDSPPSPIDA
jgi:putative membrane protein